VIAFQHTPLNTIPLPICSRWSRRLPINLVTTLIPVPFNELQLLIPIALWPTSILLSGILRTRWILMCVWNIYEVVLCLLMLFVLQYPTPKDRALVAHVSASDSHRYWWRCLLTVVLNLHYWMDGWSIPTTSSMMTFELSVWFMSTNMDCINY